MKNLKTLIYLLAIVTSISIFSFSVQAIENLKAEEIIAKHLDSIGTKEKRAEIKNQIILCNVQVNSKGNNSVINGNAVIASFGSKNIWGMKLNSNTYPLDQYSYNGKDAKIAFTTPGVRSILGEFIFSYKELLKEGLLGGVLASSWSLTDIERNRAKISVDGIKKIDGKETYILSYSPKSGSDLEIKMYFDKTSFHHVRTEYYRFIGARQGPSIDASATQTSDTYQLTEDFSNFQDMGGLTLPKNYKISYRYFNNSASQTAQRKSVEIEWKFIVTNFSYNQQLDDNSFEIEGN